MITPRGRRIAIGTLIIAAVGCFAWIAGSVAKFVFMLVFMLYVTKEEEHFLTNEIDPQIMRDCLRGFAEQRSWRKGDFNSDDPLLPACVRVLRQNGVSIEHDYVEAGFGGAFQRFELRAFPSGVEGYGTKKLAEGFWYWSE